MGFGRGKGFSPVIPDVEPPEPSYGTNDCQPTKDAPGFSCSEENAGSQTFSPDHSYTATGLSLMLRQFDDLRRGPLIVKIEKLAVNCWEAEVIWSKALYSTDLPPSDVDSITYIPIDNLALEDSTPYRITVHTTPGWEGWDGDEWIPWEAGAAIRWPYKSATNPYPRGGMYTSCNYKESRGAWAPIADADFWFCLHDVTDPTIKSTDLEVVAGSDDCYTYGTTIRPDFAYIFLDHADYDFHSYFRFLAVPIPPGATILSASIVLCAYLSVGIVSPLQVRGIKEPNTLTFSTQADADGRPVTDAYKDWSAVIWTQYEWYGRFNNFCNLKDIIQEIIDQDDWAASNALAIKIINLGNTITRQCYAWDFGPGTYPAKLHIEYRE